MLCAVCLCDVATTDGVVDTHRDLTGRPCPMSGQPGFVWDERATREAVPGRSGGRCEYCRGAGTEMHHRIARSQGGLWAPSNILHLCHEDHHDFTFVRRTLGYELGVLLRHHQIPADVPVQTPTGLLWLSDDDVAPPLPGWAR
jgi:hypothetical protein